MMVICQSRPEIDIKEAVGVYEFSVVPRSMFAADGNMLHSLEKPDWIKTCSDLADHFTVTIFHKYRDADEVRVIFDRYDVPLSLKTATREFRQRGLEPISYKITDTTQISNEPFLMQVPMKRLLAHVSTKDELTQYLASKTLEKGRQNGLHVVVAWSSKCRATHQDMAYLDSDQEEADTKILLHTVDATASGAKSIKIFSPDTDVWNAFLQADEDCVTALADLGSTILPTAGMFYVIEKLVCQLYLPKTKISSLKDLRWLLFRRKQAESE
ncbi:unnamed protein product [Porites lobata]|uniref:Thioredoxin domain-containing protein n=1 Tax=Porites lobata TaxID=104759 RepID=A0ABN8PDI9_9CNID|nr:unnamed protein product [Porites lobata]